ncbi:MAG TPA: hypothetical protein DCE42_28440 [Myxococcales bacterium]|nr:hypothetical protein [Deltaproteobacteria bacterium]MBU47299.1 hypothetical protein [Deltaproteobacteria bacterium]HAA58725.1 hypothetical protein [Myxococcales bacterium]
MIEELIVCPTCGHKNPPEARFCQEDGTALHDGDPTDPLVGRIVGNYRLIQRKGEGGFGVVYYAEHRDLGTRFAVKILHPQYSANKQVAERFRREALAAGRLRHEHVVYIADFGMAKGIGYYYAMEFLEGRTLKDAIDAKEVFDAERILHIAKQVTSAMSRVHTLNIIHRDLKPENIFLICKDGVEDYVKLVDFGIAKILDDENSSALTRTGLSVGTPLYMSPEQARGNLRTLDHRTDIYSWGIILYELLTGRPPFYSDSPHDVVMLHIRSKPPKLHEYAPHRQFSPKLQAFVNKLLSKKPHKRPESMQHALQILERLLSEPDAIKELDAAPPPSVFSMSPPEDLDLEQQDDDARVMTPLSNPATREIIQGDVESTQISTTAERLFTEEQEVEETVVGGAPPIEEDEHEEDESQPTIRHKGLSVVDKDTHEELPLVPSQQPGETPFQSMELSWQGEASSFPGGSGSPTQYFWIAFLLTILIAGFAVFSLPTSTPQRTQALVPRRTPVAPPTKRLKQRTTPPRRGAPPQRTPDKRTTPPEKRIVQVKPDARVTQPKQRPLANALRRPATPKMYQVTIRTTPRAYLYIGRRRLGRTPFTLRRRKGTKLTLRVKKKHFTSRSKRFYVNRHIRWNVTLKPLPRTSKQKDSKKTPDIFKNADNPFKNAPNPFR